MKPSLALAAIIVAGIALGGALPALAEDAAPSITDPAHGMSPMHRPHPHARDGVFLALTCSDKAGEMLEISFVRLDHRLDLTATQRPLFEAFRAKALGSTMTFAIACKSALPDSRPNPLDRFKARIALDTARVAALNEALPAFSAFYASLSDAQKALLLPPHRLQMMGVDRGTMPRAADPGRT